MKTLPGTGVGAGRNASRESIGQAQRVLSTGFPLTLASFRAVRARPPSPSTAARKSYPAIVGVAARRENYGKRIATPPGFRSVLSRSVEKIHHEREGTQPEEDGANLQAPLEHRAGMPASALRACVEIAGECVFAAAANHWIFILSRRRRRGKAFFGRRRGPSSQHARVQRHRRRGDGGRDGSGRSARRPGKKMRRRPGDLRRF